MSIDAGIRADYYEFERAALEYQQLYKTYPTDFEALRKGVPRSQWNTCQSPEES